MSAHTKGPWVARWDTTRYAGQHERIDRCVISTPMNELGACFVVARIEGPFAGQKGQAEANARLIAAAPDGLAAAIKALDECCDLIATPAGDALQAFIDKALGGDK
jgi:hypothetical protein